MKRFRHVLLGAVMAVALICCMGAYETWLWTGQNGAILDNSTNNAVTLTENSEAMTYTFGTNKITFTSATGVPGFSFGSSGTPITLTTYANSTLEIFTTCASTDASNSVRPIYMKSTMTGAAGVGGRAEFHMYTDVQLGGWANALKGYTEFGSAGGVTGLGSAIVAEMKLPGAALTTGSYAVSEVELVTTASGTTGGNPVAFEWMQVSGDATATADWEDTGYVWIFKGLTDAADNIFDTNTTPTCDATLRILVGSTPYYILLSNSPTS